MVTKTSCQRFGGETLKTTLLVLGILVGLEVLSHAQTLIYVPTADAMRNGASIQIQSQHGLIQGSDLRVVNDKLYKPESSLLFRNITGEVKGVFADGALINWTEKKPKYGQSDSDSLVSDGNFLGGVPVTHERPIIGYDTIFSKDILVLNLSIAAAEGENLSFRAMQTGTTNFEGRTVELWDCGKPYIAPPPTPEQIAAQEKARADAKAKAATGLAEAQARALKSNEDAAAAGDAYGLMRMGERYRDGDGVEKSLSKAREYLQKASDAGSMTASNELSELNQP